MYVVLLKVNVGRRCKFFEDEFFVFVIDGLVFFVVYFVLLIVVWNSWIRLDLIYICLFKFI